MKRLWLCVALAVVFFPVLAQAGFQSARYQTQINIQINVTNPLGRLPMPFDLPAPTIGLGSTRAESLHFTGSDTVAQSQKAIRVEAEVSPNPNATLLYTDQTSIVVNATAGTPVTLTCPYKVTVQSATLSSWQLRDGLYSDWIGSAGGSFPGGSVARDYYLVGGNPSVAPVAFVVYSTNGNVWASVTNGSYTKSYCVDLQLNVPSSAATGTYSSNAIYTLYY